MHKIWTVDDIKLVIDEIASRWNYPCNIKIEISKRATKRMGAFFINVMGIILYQLSLFLLIH